MFSWDYVDVAGSSTRALISTVLMNMRHGEIKCTKDKKKLAGDIHNAAREERERAVRIPGTTSSTIERQFSQDMRQVSVLGGEDEVLPSADF